ncbi:hypothetical protein BO94DRAFT_218803 [Aspergillus sclerotioniger CBS 115572]|uniref:Secreted protein n=1 Tax=Aspergillus sclerotioniger CBS 115572 TaxID=1450535 RepID=A0A317XBQ2_9EURO|nr:hypothetical protein BO94DRAFT_218803 [Aspergillus sclerotioniger CBS 115572]PWY95112.1 hypothetical protein BO94DRAFT_218803 [Aspergillus sclerotioniger CBS 115572]
MIRCGTVFPVSLLALLLCLCFRMAESWSCNDNLGVCRCPRQTPLLYFDFFIPWCGYCQQQVEHVFLCVRGDMADAWAQYRTLSWHR